MHPSSSHNTTDKQRVFRELISHPDYWLWDSWVNVTDINHIELFCLAVPRIDKSGAEIKPQHRNEHRFHIRKFSSIDNGVTWIDKGNVLSPDDARHKAYSGNVWSGSALQIGPTETLHAFTGISDGSPDNPFIQSLWLGLSTSDNDSIRPYTTPLLCPTRDYDNICSKGYYLDAPERLGHIDGEEGGPILAWRDPFIFFDSTGELRCVWSAKTDPSTPAIGHGKLQLNNGEYQIQELFAPIVLPEAETYTQAEVPKVIWSLADSLYYMLISSCDRLREGQPDSEVSKEQRLYKSKSIEGPWEETYSGRRSILPLPAYRFGSSIIDADFHAKTMRLVTPVTEQAPSDPLTIAPIIEIHLP